METKRRLVVLTKEKRHSHLRRFDARQRARVRVIVADLRRARVEALDALDVAIFYMRGILTATEIEAWVGQPLPSLG